MKTLGSYTLREVSSTPSHTSLWSYVGRGVSISLWCYHDTHTWDLHVEGTGFDIRAKGNSEDEVREHFANAVSNAQKSINLLSNTTANVTVAVEVP